ncbi:MAG: class I SAM-dependent methyltransferase [Patescibacteria group bacterium]
MDIQTIATYNALAQAYDNETVDFWARFPADFVDEFAGRVSGKVLNVGSGPGRDSVLLRNREIDVTCFDASEAMIALTQAQGFRSVLGDFESMLFADGEFGGVWAYTSLLHMPKFRIDVAMNEIRRVLKDGGVFAIGMREGDFDGYRPSSEIDAPRWFSFYSKTELEEILVRNGFEIVHFAEYTPGTKNYLNFIVQK